MDARVIDFLYDNNELLLSLVEVLKKERNFTNIDPTSLRVYKLVIAVEQLKPVGKDDQISLEYKKNIAALKMEALRLAPDENLVFFERATMRERDSWYFYNYLKGEITDTKIRSELYSFARATALAS